MHPFHFTHGIRTSSRTLRFWSIYGIMPLSELAALRPKVHHRPPNPMGVEQLTTAHELRAGLVARLVDAADLVLVRPRPPSSLPQIRSKADRHCRRQLPGTLEKESSHLVKSTQAYTKYTQIARSNSPHCSKECMVTQVASSNIEIVAKSLKVPGIVLVTQI